MSAPPLPPETGRCPLFGGAPSERVVEIIATDWQRFSMVAFFLAGIPQTWVDALAELAALQQRFLAEGRPTDPLDRLFELLLERTDWLCFYNGARDAAMTRLWETMGLTETLGDYHGWQTRRRQLRAEQAKRERRAEQDALLIAKYGPDALTSMSWWRKGRGVT